MIRRIVARPVSILTAIGALVVLGTFSLFQLPVAPLPPLERPSVEIRIESPDLTQQALFERIVEPLEPRLLSIDDVVSVRSLIGDGEAAIQVEGDWSVAADRFQIEVERRVVDLGNDPRTSYTVASRLVDRSPAVEVAIIGGESASHRTIFAKDLLVPRINSLADVSRTEVVGMTLRHAVVRPDGARLAARGMTAADLVERLGSIGVPYGLGEVRRGSRVEPLVAEETVESLEELRRLRLEGVDGPRLGDVAVVGLRTIPDGSFAHVNGEDAVLVRIHRAPGANGLSLVTDVKSVIRDLGPSARGIRVRVVNDRLSEIVDSLWFLGFAVLLGLLAGTLVLRWMLRAWRPSLVLALVVPGAIMSSFTSFYFFDVGLDLISLSGLGLAVGLLVDSAIVVLESIESERAAGVPDPAVEGPRKVLVAVAAAYLTTAVVFLPLVYLKGVARAFFGVQALVLASSLLFALLLSFTLIPVLHRESRSVASSSAPGSGLFLRALGAMLDRPVVAVLILGLTVASAALVLLGLPRELLPTGATREVEVLYRLPDAIDEERQIELGRSVLENVTAGVASLEPREIVAFQTPIDLFSEPDRPQGTIVVRFTESAGGARALSRLRESDLAPPGVELTVEPRATALLAAARWASTGYELVASTESADAASALAERLEHRMAESKSLRRAAVGRKPVQRSARLDRFATAQGELTSESFRREVSAGLGNLESGRVAIPGIASEIVVEPTRIPQLEALPIRGSESGGVLPLGTWTTLRETRRTELLERREGRWVESVPVRLSAPGDAEALHELAQGTGLREGESVRLGGRALEIEESFRQLALLLALSVLLVSFVIVALYESFALCALVMTTVPLGLAGGVYLLAATGQSLNILSFLGLVVLAGIVVNNAIILIDRAERERRAGADPRRAVTLAAADRYRPIMITTLTTMAGLLPLAILGGDGVELRRALSLAVVGGLVTSTITSLVLIPTLYHAAFSRRRTSPDEST